MWFLNKTTQSLKAITLEAATTDLTFVVVYHAKNGRLNIGPITGNGTFDETLTAIVPAPAPDEGFDVKNIVAVNVDNINHNVVFYFNDGTDRIIFKCLLKPNWSVTWQQEFGWQIYNDEGQEVQFITDRVLNQSNPGAVLTDLYTVPAGKRANITIVAGNRTNANRTFRIAISPLGAAIADSHYTHYDRTLSGNDTHEDGVYYELMATDIVRVYGSTAGVSFTANGIEY
jgi:hypothetical protein